MASKEQSDPGQGETRKQRGAPRSRDVVPDDVAAASAESFPASDPPSWTGMRAGPPDRADEAPGA
ncbi:MAG TPA: hypothetical protein VJ650_03045 [Gemmatimonadaceae bacterium]|nr:hypothetical protein [Gemmatimonadaceae bacterium]